MKKIFAVLFVIVFLSYSVIANEEQEYYYTGGMDYMGSSGFEVGCLLLNQGDFKTLTEGAGYPALPEGVFYYGWSSMFGFRNGIRWGGYNYQGQTKAIEGEALSKLVFGSWGLLIDYGYVLMDSLDVAGGISLGGTTYELTLKNGNLADLTNPNKIFLTNAFFTVGPRLSLTYKLNEWFAIQGSAGYLYGIGSDKWKDEKDRITVVPPLRVNGSIFGLAAQFTF